MVTRKGLESEFKGGVFYISPYLPKEDEYQKHYSPAAQTKVDYIRSKLVDYSGIAVCVNCSLTVDDSTFWPKTVVDEYGECRVLFSKSFRNRILLPVSMIIMLLSVFFYVLFHVKKNDIVILYHSIFYDSMVIFLKKIKKFKLVYEIEEIYADVRDGGIGRNKEVACCEKVSDAFIFPTEMLDETVNQNHKKSIIVYGAYKPEEREMLQVNGDRKKTLIVYSGTLMKGKGATQAIEAAKSLDSNYEIRIIGYGNQDEIDTIQQLIEKNNSECKVVFDGMKYGSEYIDYLRNCDIGLCIQPSDAEFNATSFPSKILSYLNCGLRVVATNMETLRRSKLSELITFSNGSNAAEVAGAVQEAVKKQANNKEVLNQLNDEVTVCLRNVLIN